MNRTSTFRRFAAALALVSVVAFVGVAGLGAQTFTHNTTTLASAQSATDSTLVLTAVTAASGSSFGAVAAGQFIFVDQELELITSMSSTTATVRRGTRPVAHASGAPVFIGPGSAFQNADPAPGTCVINSFPKWWINQITGSIFTCPANLVISKGGTPWLTGLNSGNGATVTLSAADSGKTFLFDRAAGIVYTLPPPSPGMTFDFVYTVTVTSNAYTVITNAGTQFVAGIIHTAISGGATGSDWQCNGTSHVKVTSNGTTSGGILGGRLHFTAASATVWQVDGILVGSGTEVTPCST